MGKNIDQLGNKRKDLLYIKKREKRKENQQMTSLITDVNKICKADIFSGVCI